MRIPVVRFTRRITEWKVTEDEARNTTVFDDVLGTADDDRWDAFAFKVVCDQTRGLVADGSVGDTVIDICLKGVFFAIKHEARAMLATGGAIVNISSLNCHVPMYGGSAYTAAKAGVEMLSRNAALELAHAKVRVNTVSPGLTDTPLTTGFREVQGVEQAFMERIPMRRWGAPEDIAAAALFLASEDAGYITGSNLVVDGGWETTGYPDLKVFREAFTP